MLGDRPPGSVRERGDAEIRQLAPFELRRPFNQGLRRFVDAKAEPFFPKPSVDLCWHCTVAGCNGTQPVRRAEIRKYRSGRCDMLYKRTAREGFR